MNVFGVAALLKTFLSLYIFIYIHPYPQREITKWVDEMGSHQGTPLGFSPESEAPPTLWPAQLSATQPLCNL